MAVLASRQPAGLVSEPFSGEEPQRRLPALPAYGLPYTGNLDYPYEHYAGIFSLHYNVEADVFRHMQD